MKNMLISPLKALWSEGGMARRKHKPGPKRRVGRPATAQRREKDVERLKGEREILAEMGYQYVTVVVADEYASFLKEAGKILRIKGLLEHAEQVGDLDKARLLRAKLEIAEVERARALAERSARKAEAVHLAEMNKARRARADAAAQRLAESRNALSPDQSAEGPPTAPQRLTEEDLRAVMKRYQSIGVL